MYKTIHVILEAEGATPTHITSTLNFLNPSEMAYAEAFILKRHPDAWIYWTTVEADLERNGLRSLRQIECDVMTARKEGKKVYDLFSTD